MVLVVVVAVAIVVLVLVVIVVVVVVVVVVHFSPKFIYISVWQQHTSRLQTCTTKVMYERAQNVH